MSQLWLSSCSSFICWKIILSPTNCLVGFVESHMAVCMWVYFGISFPWTPCLSLHCSAILIAVASSPGNVSPSSLCFFFKTVLTLQGPWRFHANFRISLLISVKKPAGTLIGINITLNPCINWERTDIFLLNMWTSTWEVLKPIEFA